MSDDNKDGGESTTAPAPAPETPPNQVDNNSAESNGSSSEETSNTKANGVQKSPFKRRGQFNSPPPNSTIVMKNLDFGLQPVDLEDVLRGLSGGRLGYKNFYFHKDSQGQFRGMVFVNFHSIEDAQKAITELMPLVLNGRKVYVEYRRLSRTEVARKEYEEKRGHGNKRFDILKPRTTFENSIDDSTPVLDENGKELDKRAAFFKRYTEERGETKFVMNGKNGRGPSKNPENAEFEKKYRDLLVAYRDDENVEGEEIPDFKFEEQLDSNQRFLVHQLCDQLGLAHISRYVEEPASDTKKENGDDAEGEKSPPPKSRRMIIVSRDPEKRASFKKESIQQRKVAKELAAKKRKELVEKKKQPVKVPLTEEEHSRIKWFKPRAQQASEGKEQPTNEIMKPSYKMYVPPRQPTGPDGTTGFKSRMAKHSISDEKQASDKSDESQQDTGVKDNGNGSSEESAAKSSNEPKVANGKKGRGKRGKAKKLNPLVRPFVPSSAAK
eukprot:Plantae.Rhodophyta-Hildenbrandia_rubra.ctg2765.p1 GENE.Plantae.Rhodophyta-Hildenbrandia_rubra.ctg2765~~Plantae.Rhodophyta-Hildenbrandia_rubra.ctg2765.p1  ORF type:complete len:496 (-),score=125.50 Plantae.Rhodophyta-Hildenbrandia_rubra.ctg2765:2447-3934(-)